MNRSIWKLNAGKIQSLKVKGRYADGNGLYLQVSKSLTKSWIFRYMMESRSYEMGIGPLTFVSLHEARDKAFHLQKQLLSGVNPLTDKKRKLEERRIRAQIDKAKLMTFDECAKAYIESHKSSWKNGKHIYQWEMSLSKYVSPYFGKLPVQDIETGHVIKALEPIWSTKTETASRTRNRIEIILNWAKAREFRTGDNPARWKGHLDSLLPERSKIQKVIHHPSIPYAEIGAFVETLRKQEGLSPRALEFLILTAARTGEVIYAKWEEFNFEENLWTIPAERMKAAKEHRVPLSNRCIEILEALPRFQDNEYVFIGGKKGKPLSNIAMLALMRRMKKKEVPHGFRSTFRDWCAEKTNFPREVAESCLAHTLKDKTEAAYQRGDFLLKRKLVMSEWAKFCATPRAISAEVIPMKRDAIQ